MEPVRNISKVLSDSNAYSANSIDDDVKPHKRESFELLKVLGKGGYGKVFQVRKKDGCDKNNLYAMKVIKKSFVSKNGHELNVMSERSILSKLDSPFTCELYYSFQTNEKLYFVLHYYAGGDLFSLLEKHHTLKEETAIFYITEVMVAILYLHSLDIIYRDLKPDNVMIDYAGHVVLTDFGLSKEMKGMKKTSTFCGTNEYMAPEIIRKVGYGAAVDFWGLGILLFDMLAGNSPFNTGDVREQIVSKNPIPMPKSASTTTKHLLSRLLDRNQDTRITAEGIKSHKFFAKIDWKKAESRQLIPPFKPSIINDEDCSAFSAQFTKMKPTESVSKPMNNADSYFRNFSYTSSSLSELENEEPVE